MFNLIKRKLHNLISDQKLSEILTGSAWALSARVISTGLGLLTSVIIARFYGADVMGIVAVLNSFLLLTTIFTVLGTNTSILRLIPEYLAKYSPTSAFQVYRKIQYFVAGMSVITGAILFSASGFIADAIFSKPNLQFYFALGAIFIIFQSLLHLNTGAVRGLRLSRTFALMQLLPQLCRLLILVLITIFFYNKDNPIYAMFASVAVTALVGAWIMDWVFKQKMRPNDIVHSMPLKSILGISLPMFMESSMSFVIGQTGVIMLGIFRTEAEVGYYAIAVKLATLTAFIFKAITTIAAPKFSQLFHEGKIEELFYVAKRSAMIIFWTSTPILLGLVLLGEHILSFFFGQEFVIAYRSLLILVVGQFIFSTSGAAGIFMIMTGNQTMFGNIMIIAAMSNIGINILLVPIMGSCGAAIAATCSISLWNLFAIVTIKLKYGRTTSYLPFIGN